MVVLWLFFLCTIQNVISHMPCKYNSQYNNRPPVTPIPYINTAGEKTDNSRDRPGFKGYNPNIPVIRKHQEDAKPNYPVKLSRPVVLTPPPLKNKDIKPGSVIEEAITEILTENNSEVKIDLFDNCKDEYKNILPEVKPALENDIKSIVRLNPKIILPEVKTDAIRNVVPKPSCNEPYPKPSLLVKTSDLTVNSIIPNTIDDTCNSKVEKNIDIIEFNSPQKLIENKPCHSLQQNSDRDQNIIPKILNNKYMPRTQPPEDRVNTATHKLKESYRNTPPKNLIPKFSQVFENNTDSKLIGSKYPPSKCSTGNDLGVIGHNLTLKTINNEINGNNNDLASNCSELVNSTCPKISESNVSSKLSVLERVLKIYEDSVVSKPKENKFIPKTLIDTNSEILQNCDETLSLPNSEISIVGIPDNRLHSIDFSLIGIPDNSLHSIDNSFIVPSTITDTPKFKWRPFDEQTSTCQNNLPHYYWNAFDIPGPTLNNVKNTDTINLNKQNDTCDPQPQPSRIVDIKSLEVPVFQPPAKRIDNNNVEIYNGHDIVRCKNEITKPSLESQTLTDVNFLEEDEHVPIIPIPCNYVVKPFTQKQNNTNCDCPKLLEKPFKRTKNLNDYSKIEPDNVLNKNFIPIEIIIHETDDETNNVPIETVITIDLNENCLEIDNSSTEPTQSLDNITLQPPCQLTNNITNNITTTTNYINETENNIKDTEKDKINLNEISLYLAENILSVLLKYLNPKLDLETKPLISSDILDKSYHFDSPISIEDETNTISINVELEDEIQPEVIKNTICKKQSQISSITINIRPNDDNNNHIVVLV